MRKETLRKYVCGLMVVMAASFVLTACVSTRWQKPEVSLADVRLAGGNLLQQNLRLQLRVRNPNDVDIGVDEMKFDLLIGADKFASGQSIGAVTIPRNGEAMVEVEARAHALSLLARLPQLLDSEGLLHYRLQGDALIHDYGRVPFDHPGTLDPAKLRLPAGRKG